MIQAAGNLEATSVCPHEESAESSHSGLLERPIHCIRRNAVSAETARTELEQFKLSMQKYAPVNRGLPWECQSQCVQCGRTVPSTFLYDAEDDKVYLEIRCEQCGTRREFHHDVLFVTNKPTHTPHQPNCTHKGVPIRPVVRDLPKTVETLCPECSCIILGRYYVKDEVVWIEKTCPEHGYFRDKVNTDVNMYLKATRHLFEDERGVLEPQVEGAHNCPSDCGLCDQHLSASCLPQIDLSNRCNLTCPVCFASANSAGYVSEPSYDMVVEMLQALRDQHPYPATAVQFTGGEPTIHPEFHRYVAKAREMGFTHIQIATNGITHANFEFAQRSAEAGLHTLYMQFDGVDDAFYRKTRGEPLFEKKMQAIENCGKLGMKIVLVPTIIKGFNDDQVGSIFEFAVQHVEAISAIAYQPVAFTGRINRRQLAAQRYTLGDLAHDIAKASGADIQRDFEPLGVMAPLSRIMECIDGKPKIRASCHSECAFGTYFFVTPEKKAVPVPRLFDIHGLMADFNRLAKKIKARHPKANRLELMQIAAAFVKNYRWREFGKTDIKPWTFIRALQGLTDKSKGRGEGEKRSYKTLMAAGMHFMDRYNYDTERVKRCVILYSTVDGMYPFCTINGGPTYRPYIEKMYAQQNAEWQAAHPDMALRPSSHPNATMPWIGRFGQPVDEKEPWVGRDVPSSAHLPVLRQGTGGNGHSPRNGGNGNGRHS